MQKQVAIQHHDHEASETTARAAPQGQLVRLAGAASSPVDSPARRLQQDVAAAFGARNGWSVKRTVLLGAAYHLVVLAALGLAATQAVVHLMS